jgi:hypothetical protein
MKPLHVAGGLALRARVWPGNTPYVYCSISESWWQRFAGCVKMGHENFCKSPGQLPLSDWAENGAGPDNKHLNKLLHCVTVVSRKCTKELQESKVGTVANSKKQNSYSHGPIRRVRTLKLGKNLCFDAFGLHKKKFCTTLNFCKLQQERFFFGQCGLPAGPAPA